MAKKKASGPKKVLLSIPEDTYLTLMQMSREDIRSISGQARFLMEVGIQVISQQKMADAMGLMGDESHGDCEGSDQERAPAIGFHVPSPSDIDEEDEEQEEDKNKRSKRKR